jgi:hypothetical protein
VEGFELFVLRGAKKMVAKWRPILFVELVEENLRQQNYSGIDLIEYIENLGYSVLDARSMEPIQRYDRRQHTDILCFPLS